MTKFTDTLKPLELFYWNDGSTWQRARIAFRHDAMEELSIRELKELLDTLEEVNFYADMSDNWNVTLREKRENNAIAVAATHLLEGK